MSNQYSIFVVDFDYLKTIPWCESKYLESEDSNISTKENIPVITLS